MKLSNIAITLSVLATTTTLALPVAMAESVQEPNQPTANMSQTVDVEPMSTNATLTPPLITTTIYNTAVEYTWHTCINADALAMGYGSSVPIIFNSLEFKEITYINDGKKECIPQYYWGMSYDTKTDTYSDIAETAWKEQIDDGVYQVHYGVNAKYNIVGKLNPAQIADNIPTSFDEKFYIWDNNAKNFQIIKGTISYHGYISDIEVSVPWIGYNSASVTLDGITFTLRTGPWKCSIKADRSVPVSDLGFGFGIL